MIRAFLSIKNQCIKSERAYKANFYLLVFAGIITKFVGFGVPFILFEGVWSIPEMVFTGKLDVLLIRPMNPLLQVLSYGAGIHGLGDLLFGVPTLIYLHISLGLVDLVSIICSFIYVISGMILCLAIYIISNSIVFLFDFGGRTSIPYMVANIGQYAKYPLKIYPAAIQIMLCFVIPYAFMGIIPTMIITRRISIIYLLLVECIVLFFFCNGFANL